MSNSSSSYSLPPLLLIFSFYSLISIDCCDQAGADCYDETIAGRFLSIYFASLLCFSLEVAGLSGVHHHVWNDVLAMYGERRWGRVRMREEVQKCGFNHS
uniref:Uncharacterized protein n=1 Tax=Nelumbo nucifera TaxID=4432 RepID=A0A822XUC6_NELNU|nr:TPA_asm: hypothetical protein HUJ06_023969 [Nelumbo nucifera]